MTEALKKLKKYKDVIISGVFTLILLITLVVGYSCFSNNKLSTEEVDKLTSFYTNLHDVTPSCDTWRTNDGLSVLNRSLVDLNLRKDSLTYSIKVCAGLFELLSDGTSADKVYLYILRCDVPFSDFVSLKVNTTLFDMYEKFLKLNTQTSESVYEFQAQFDALVKREQKIIRNTQLFYVCILIGSALISFTGCFVSIKCVRRLKDGYICNRR